MPSMFPVNFLVIWDENVPVGNRGISASYILFSVVVFNFHAAAPGSTFTAI